MKLLELYEAHLDIDKFTKDKSGRQALKKVPGAPPWPDDPSVDMSPSRNVRKGKERYGKDLPKIKEPQQRIMSLKDFQREHPDHYNTFVNFLNDAKIKITDDIEIYIKDGAASAEEPYNGIFAYFKEGYGWISESIVYKNLKLSKILYDIFEFEYLLPN